MQLGLELLRIYNASSQSNMSIQWNRYFEWQLQQFKLIPPTVWLLLVPQLPLGIIA